MDTKSKSFNDLRIVRVSAAVLCVIACAVMAAGWMNAWKAWEAYTSAEYGVGSFLDLLADGGYEDSRGFRTEQNKSFPSSIVACGFADVGTYLFHGLYLLTGLHATLLN